MYLEGINLSKAAPTATIQFDVKGASGVRKVTKTVNEGFNLYPNSGEMEEYKNNGKKPHESLLHQAGPTAVKALKKPYSMPPD